MARQLVLQVTDCLLQRFSNQLRTRLLVARRAAARCARWSERFTSIEEASFLIPLQAAEG